MNLLYLLTLTITTLIFIGCAQSIEEKQLVKDDKNITIQLEAVVYPSVNQDILSPFEGEISKVFKKNGSAVKKGDVLYQFDLKNSKIDIKKLKNEIKILEKQIDADNKYQDNQYIRNNTKLYLEKITALHAQGYATQAELFNAKKEYYAQKEITTNRALNQEKARDSLLMLLDDKKSQLQKIQYEIENATVISDYDGYLVNSHIKIGAQVAKYSNMGTIINISNVTVKAGLASGLYPFIHKGDSVHIDFIVTPPYSVEANITKIVPIIDPKLGRMVVDIALENRDYILQDGMRAMVKIGLKKEYQDKVKKFFIDKKEQKIVEINSDIGER